MTNNNKVGLTVQQNSSQSSIRCNSNQSSYYNLKQKQISAQSSASSFEGGGSVGAGIQEGSRSINATTAAATLQWIRKKMTLSTIFTRHSRDFQRNDSSNSNSSSAASVSAPVTANNTPNSTPLKRAYANTRSLSYTRQNSMLGCPPSQACSSASMMIGPSPLSPSTKKFASHTKLGAKSLSTATCSNSSPTILMSNRPSGSLRRRRFKQQYQTRIERRLSRANSNVSPTSLSTSQEHSFSGTSIAANPIVDRLLEYVRENFSRQIDPFRWNIQKKFRLTAFASFRIESGQLTGASNFERIGDSRLIKSLEELTTIVLASNVFFSDLLAEITFTTKFAKFTMRDKQLRIFIEKCIVYLEISVDHTMSAKLKTLRLISLDGVETKTRGVPFPLNKSIESFSLKTVHMMAANSEKYTEPIIPMVNQFCDSLINEALKSLSITDLFW